MVKKKKKIGATERLRSVSVRQAAPRPLDRETNFEVRPGATLYDRDRQRAAQGLSHVRSTLAVLVILQGLGSDIHITVTASAPGPGPGRRNQRLFA